MVGAVFVYEPVWNQGATSVDPPASQPSDHADAGTDGLPPTERRAAVTTNAGDLHEYLLTLTEAHRNSTLLMILRDVGAACTEVLSSQHLAETLRTWRTDCGGTQTYSVVFDAYGETTVYPIPIGDFSPGAGWVVSPIEPQ